MDIHYNNLGEGQCVGQSNPHRLAVHGIHPLWILSLFVCSICSLWIRSIFKGLPTLTASLWFGHLNLLIDLVNCLFSIHERSFHYKFHFYTSNNRIVYYLFELLRSILEHN